MWGESPGCVVTEVHVGGVCTESVRPCEEDRLQCIDNRLYVSCFDGRPLIFDCEGMGAERIDDGFARSVSALVGASCDDVLVTCGSGLDCVENLCTASGDAGAPSVDGG